MTSSAEKLKDDYHFEVLIVDDDPTILGLLKEIITMIPGCSVHIANDPGEAMAIVVKTNIDIVFTDIHMPGTNGIDMIKDMIALEKTPEIVIMTAYPSSEIAQDGLELGATSLLGKPFNDISLVEGEVEKAIKNILRKRANLSKIEFKNKVEKEKAIPQKSNTSDQEAFPSSDMSQAAQLAQDEPSTDVEGDRDEEVPISFEDEEAGLNPPFNFDGLKIFGQEIFEPLIEIEGTRCARYNRQFAVGLVDFPDEFNPNVYPSVKAYRLSQLKAVRSVFRKSDVVLDAGRDGVYVLAFECNKIGVTVLEHKLSRSGFTKNGFSVFPMDGEESKVLIEKAKDSLLDKNRHRIILIEQEDFFGRIVQNMLADPKYHMSWVKDYDEAYRLVSKHAEQVKVMILSLKKDKAQWQLLAKLKKEGMSQWPIVIFTDVRVTEDLRKKLKLLGVQAVIRKGASQEEFNYIIQQFVMPKPILKERKNSRALVTCPVVYKLKGKEISSNCFTLSRDGIFVRDMSPPASGERVEIEIFIPSREAPVRTRVEILYTIPYFIGATRFHVAGFAARFEGLDPLEQDFIDQYVNQVLASYLL